MDGKILHRPRVRVQRAVDSGHLRWKDSHTAEEVKRSASSDPHRFLKFSTPVFDYEYPIGSDGEKAPHFVSLAYATVPNYF